MRSRLKIVFLAVGVVLSLLVMFYPTISDIWNRHVTGDLVGEYEQAVEEQQASGDLNQLWADAVAYNQHLGETEVLEQLGLTYENLLNPLGNGVMGYLNISKIRVALPIYHTYEDSVLSKGVGHMEGTALPVGGEGTRCVLAGHTGLASAKLISNLDQLKIGDVFQLKILDQTLYYQVIESIVVLPNEVGRIRPVAGEELVTIVTCTPYGINSHRLLVTGKRVSEEEVMSGGMIDRSDANFIDPVKAIPLIAAIVLAMAGFVYVLSIVVEKKRKRHEE